MAIGGTPETIIGGVYGWTVVSEFASLECTVMNEVWRTYRPGLPGWNGTMMARFNNAEGQEQLLATVTGLTRLARWQRCSFKLMIRTIRHQEHAISAGK